MRGVHQGLQPLAIQLAMAARHKKGLPPVGGAAKVEAGKKLIFDRAEVLRLCAEAKVSVIALA
jgi:hypothetical protein